jgi:ABC-type branched-subunit amino acid transport system ATPase component
MLSCRDIDMAYGSVQILFGVDFDVAEGEVVALLGTNGAGKSTLLKGICGLVRPKRGRVMWKGSDITKMAADITARHGISLMPGGKGVFPTLSVAENLRMAAWLIRDDPDRIEAAREEVLDLFPILAQRHGQMAGNLSGGEQQMLALGSALMTRPELLMIDELSLGLAPTIVGQLLEVVQEVHRRGTTIVIVEQSVNVALNLARRAVFMEKGEVRFEGPAAELLERPDILRSVFIAGAGSKEATAAVGGSGAAIAVGASGAAASEVPTTVAASESADTLPDVAEDAKVVLSCREIVKRFGGITAVDHVGLEVHQGEIVGLIGHNGAGKTTLMDCISGFLPLDGGRIVLRGVDVTDWAPHLRARGAMGRSFQDAMLFPTLTVAETIAVALERHLASKDMFAAALHLPASYESELEVATTVDELIDLMGLGAYRQKLTGELSTGTRRIVDIACIMAQDPKVLMLDEPSGGVAQKETEALGPLLRRVAQRTSCSILIIEHDMPLLSGLCHRLVALELGGVIAEGTPDVVLSHPAVIASYLGTDEKAIARSGAQAPAAVPVLSGGSGGPGGSGGSGGSGADEPYDYETLDDTDVVDLPVPVSAPASPRKRVAAASNGTRPSASGRAPAVTTPRPGATGDDKAEATSLRRATSTRASAPAATGDDEAEVTRLRRATSTRASTPAATAKPARSRVASPTGAATRSRTKPAAASPAQGRTKSASSASSANGAAPNRSRPKSAGSANGDAAAPNRSRPKSAGSANGAAPSVATRARAKSAGSANGAAPSRSRAKSGGAAVTNGHADASGTRTRAKTAAGSTNGRAGAAAPAPSRSRTKTTPAASSNGHTATPSRSRAKSAAVSTNGNAAAPANGNGKTNGTGARTRTKAGTRS